MSSSFSCTFSLLCVVFAFATLCHGAPSQSVSTSEADSNAQFYAELDKLVAERVQSASLTRNAKAIQCPVGFVPSTSEDTCHYFSPPQLNIGSWFYAKSACETVGGRLASIETSQEDNYLRDTLKRLYTSAEMYHSWIGATCLRTIGQFRWAHNDTLAKYFGWYSGQPNNAGGTEHCVAMRRDWGYAWDDLYCTGLASRFICEYP